MGSASGVRPTVVVVGPVAGRYDAPLFTTPSTPLADEPRDGLIAYGPKNVVIAGGTGAISAGVEAEIQSALMLADHQVVRAAGANRHDTAGLIAAMLDDHDSPFRDRFAFGDFNSVSLSVAACRATLGDRSDPRVRLRVSCR